MKIRIIALLCVLLSACESSDRSNEGFKDFKLGMPIQKLKDMEFTCKQAINAPDYSKCEKKYLNVQYNSEGVESARKQYAPEYTMAGAPISKISIDLYKDRAVYISVKTEHMYHQRVLSAFQEKYGATEDISAKHKKYEETGKSYLINENSKYEKRTPSHAFIAISSYPDASLRDIISFLDVSIPYGWHLTKDGSPVIWGAEERPLSRYAKDL